MTALIGTVHKPPQTEVPEPEGWMELVCNDIDRRWHAAHEPLMSREEFEEENVGRLRSAAPRRLVHIGPAPKVPVRDIQLAVSTLRAAANSTELGARESLLNCAARLTHWLGESEREKGGREWASLN